MKLRRNELRLRFLYYLRRNSTYTESLYTLDDRDDQNYVENEGATKQTGVYLRKLQQRYSISLIVWAFIQFKLVDGYKLMDPYYISTCKYVCVYKSKFYDFNVIKGSFTD